MRVTAVLFACLCICTIIGTQGVPSLGDIDSDLSMIESEASRAVTASEVLAEAQNYAAQKVAAALEKGKSLLADAAAKGRADAVKLGPEPEKPKSNASKLEKAKAKAEAKAAIQAEKVREKIAAEKASAEAKKQVEAIAKEKAAKIAAKAAKVAATTAKIQKKELAKRLSPFKAGKLKSNKLGVFGAVKFGLPKAESTPVPLSNKPKGTALERFSKFAPKKNIYGRRKSCLKDIAAHFDEKDIYDSKKIALLQQMSTTKSRAHATQLRSKLQSLETWHQMMQKKFLMSAQQQKAHKRRVEALFDQHLPQELKDQLKANKVAKRAAQKLPFPDAHAQAMKILRGKRKEIQRQERMQSHGHKRWLRPEINDKGFPSMDPISSHLRERLWRLVETQDDWSTDKQEMERAENIVTAAHKQHGDFVEGPIAAPILRGKLYHPMTERLGVPDFLTKFPEEWKKQEDKVTMDDKVKVEQTYHQTW